MPYYTISYGKDPSGKNVGNSYSHWMIQELLRDKYGYSGVVCTDWNITYDNRAIESFDGKCWGVENLTVAERHYQVLLSGVDQFGGNNDKGPVLEAYQMFVRDFGEAYARERFEASAARLLMNSFRTGLFENPYTCPTYATKVVGQPSFMEAGYRAQVKSVVLTKNHNGALPMQERLKVYVPKRFYPQMPGMFGLSMGAPAHWDYPVDRALVEKYFDWADTPQEADFALVLIQEPSSGSGYDVADRQKGGNGYVPISLQYRPYKAVYARAESIAGGDPKETFTNRSYKGKTVKTYNEADLDLVINTRKAMGDKPVVVAVSLSRPAVLSELEPYADAVLLRFGVQNQAVLDLVSGAYEPSALLPMQMPADMRTVEEQCEDVPHDMRALLDADGNAWNFGFGLNWSGVISDDRTQRYASDVKD
jgi:beta-glucosidase